jgi:hypothetical protein
MPLVTSTLTLGRARASVLGVNCLTIGRRGLPRIAAEADVGRDGRDAERVTTTLTKRQKSELDRLAAAQGVKVAWLVRRAVERYLEDESGGPMLPFEAEGSGHAKP